MKLVLKAHTSVPYGGGYQITDRVTGVSVFGTTFKMLFTRMCDQRRANSTPIGLGFQDEVEAWCCEQYPAEATINDANLMRRRGLSFDDVVRGTRVIASFKLAGSPLVDPQEAERRAAICSQCPMNITFPTPCAGICGQLAEVVNAIVGAQRTPTDNSKKSCQVCACYTSAHVWLPCDILDKGLTDDMREQFKLTGQAYNCWKTPALTEPKTETIKAL